MEYFSKILIALFIKATHVKAPSLPPSIPIFKINSKLAKENLKYIARLF